MPLIVFIIAIWYLSLFAQSFFHHRYASHQAFSMSRFWERTFYVFSWVTQGSSYLSPRSYAIMHRMHHAYADTDKDPHSPANFRNVFAMMLHSRKVYLRIDKGLVALEKQFLRNLPEWRWFDKFAQSYYSRIPWVAAYVVLFILLAPSPWFFAFLPLIIVLGPVHGAIINWFAHKYGFTNFKLRNTSRNLLPVDVLMLGEAYHNDHHHAPSRANFGVRWFQVDPVYYVIKVFNRLRIVRLRKG